MKERLKDHLEGWQFCENCGIKLYQKINGCSGMIHLKCHRCNTLLRIDLSFRRKKCPPKTINRVHCTLNMDCSHRATGRHLRVMYET